MRTMRVALAACWTVFGTVVADAQAVDRVVTHAIRVADSTRGSPRLGDRVQIAGRVTIGLGVLERSQLNVYVQDATGSVFVDADVPHPFPHLASGDSIVVTGVIDRDINGNYLEDATVVVVPVARRELIAERIGALVPAQLRQFESRLVVVEGFVATRQVGDGDDVLTLGHADADGNYVTVVEDEHGDAQLALHRYSLGDRLRVTGVLVKRTSRRTGLTRYAVYPRGAADLVAIGTTARSRSILMWSALAAVLLGAAAAFALRHRRLRRWERLRAERELIEIAARYRELVEQAPVGMIMYHGSNVVMANTAFLRTLGADVNALQGLTLGDLFPGEDLGAITGELPTGGAPDGPRQVETTLRRPDGTRRNVELTVGPVTYQGKEYVQAVVSDVTERVEAQQRLAHSEEQLRHAQKMEAVGKLAGGIAHDFNNLLTVIKGNAEFLLGGCARCGGVAPESADISQAADRAAALTRQLLMFSRKQVLQPRVVELHTLVRGLQAMLNRLVPESVLKRYALGDQPCCIEADPGQVEQVVVNLVVNARDAMPLGGVLELSTSRVSLAASDRRCAGGALAPGEYAVLTVRDTGVGMDEGTRARAFEPFFTTKEQGRGTGLGLATVYGIVKQSAGWVDLDSHVGAGTTFTVYFPIVEGLSSGAESTPSAAVADHRGGRETILVAEDEPAIRRLAERTLRAQGYAVLVAENGVEALSLMRSHRGPIDLLLTDVVMPGLGGSDVASHLRAARPGLRVLFMSGYSEEQILGGSGISGVDLLEKPFLPAQLLERVRHTLDQQEAAA